jgi:hypothetical protein
MARRKTQLVDAELAQIPAFGAPPAPPLTATEERRDRELEELLDTIGSDGRLTVWHIMDGKATYAGNMSLDGFSLDALLDAYGGGDKSLVFYQGNRKVETIRVSLDPAIPSKNPKQRTVIAAPPATVAAAGPSLGDLSGLIAAMGQSQINAMNMIQSMQASNANNMQTMLTAVTALMTQKTPDRDPMEIVKAVLDMTKRGESSSSVQAKDLLDMFERGMKLRESVESDGSDSVTGLIGEGVRTLGTLVEGVVAEKKANAERTRAQLALPAPSIESGDGRRESPLPTETVSTPPAEQPVWLPGNTNVNALWSVAQYLQPTEAAGIIAGRLSDAQFDAMMSDIETPGFGDRLLRYFPVLRTVDPQWVAEVIQVLLTDHVEEGDPEPITSEDNGNASA